jgi:hypothetical protein
MKSTKAPALQKVRFQVNVHCPRSDVVNGVWHEGWRKAGSPTIAFRVKGKWWAWHLADEKAAGPYGTRALALAYLPAVAKTEALVSV